MKQSHTREGKWDRVNFCPIIDDKVMATAHEMLPKHYAITSHNLTLINVCSGIVQNLGNYKRVGPEIGYYTEIFECVTFNLT